MGFNYEIKIKAFLLILFFFLSFSESKAQICGGALGDPIFVEDFGRGIANIGPPIGFPGFTTYNYKTGTPNDGDYTIIHSTTGLNSGWHQNVVNHNPDDPNGYIMVVNASLTQDTFYEITIPNLCPNTTYEFAAYIINILHGSGVKPNIKFSIENDGVPIWAPSTTHDIPEGSATDWRKYGITFVTPANLGTVTLKMTNINPGGIGNDLALDDITFRACGPIINPTINNSSTVANLCIGDSKDFDLSATVSSGYNNPQYQWQAFQNGNWVDLTGETTTQTKISFNNAMVGTYKYRLVVAELANMASIGCRVASTALTINVAAKPTPIASNSGIGCIGGEVKLDVDQGVSYLWTGPNNYSSTEKSPILTDLTANDAGTYVVTVTNVAGCTNTSQTEVQTYPAVNGNTNIVATSSCEGSVAVQLEATGGTSYSWFPTAGLSDPTIANPLASPSSTTIYTVTISNGQCAVNKDIKIIVLKKSAAEAGVDKKLLIGQSTTLNGKANGDNINYFWTPTAYLDDPTKLNPIATPPTDITYTLHVESTCNTSTDDVFVKVYPKVEVPNVFTPNGDGINDTWGIPSISSFPNPRLIVVNRYGQVVFEGGKDPVWDGKQNKKDVPLGTYYYTLFINYDFKIYTGWVLITR